MTWLDALLVTLWAIVTALGVRRGLAGLFWGLGGVGICLLANLLGRGATSAGLIALLLGGLLAFLIQRFVRDPLTRPWHLLAGGAGGFLLGGVLVATLTLGFPIGLSVGLQGKTAVYPSPNLPVALGEAVQGSVLKSGLMDVWQASPALQRLIVPDRVQAKR